MYFALFNKMESNCRRHSISTSPTSTQKFKNVFATAHIYVYTHTNMYTHIDKILQLLEREYIKGWRSVRGTAQV